MYLHLEETACQLLRLPFGQGFQLNHGRDFTVIPCVKKREARDKTHFLGIRLLLFREDRALFVDAEKAFSWPSYTQKARDSPLPKNTKTNVYASNQRYFRAGAF